MFKALTMEKKIYLTNNCCYDYKNKCYVKTIQSKLVAIVEIYLCMSIILYWNA